MANLSSLDDRTLQELAAIQRRLRRKKIEGIVVMNAQATPSDRLIVYPRSEQAPLAGDSWTITGELAPADLNLNTIVSRVVPAGKTARIKTAQFSYMNNSTLAATVNYQIRDQTGDIVLWKGVFRTAGTSNPFMVDSPKFDVPLSVTTGKTFALEVDLDTNAVGTIEANAQGWDE